jgi:hypothetical protein
MTDVLEIIRSCPGRTSNYYAKRLGIKKNEFWGVVSGYIAAGEVTIGEGPACLVLYPAQTQETHDRWMTQPKP